MRTTAIFNLKGGVAKTITTAAMADILATQYRKRVLVIDADAQGNLSQYFGVSAQEGASTLDLLQGTHEPVYSDWVMPARPDVAIDIIPSDMTLLYADVDVYEGRFTSRHSMEELRAVAKTITTAAMADILATQYRKRVLVIDADAQGNLSQYFGVSAQEGASTLDLLQGTHEPVYSDWVMPARPDVAIDIIPSDMTLLYADVDVYEGRFTSRHSMEELRAAIEEDAQSSDEDARAAAYDYMLIDCPPAFSAASAAALVAADDVVIPIRLDAFSTAGMADLITQITNMQRVNPRLRVAGILATQYTNTEESIEALKYLQQSSLPVYKWPIRRSERVSAATYARVPLIQFSPHCAAARDYRLFVKEYMAQEGGDGNGER